MVPKGQCEEKSKGGEKRRAMQQNIAQGRQAMGDRQLVGGFLQPVGKLADREDHLANNSLRLDDPLAGGFFLSGGHLPRHRKRLIQGKPLT